MRRPKLRELLEALKVLFVRGPYTSKFPAQPYTAPETYRGVPRYDEDECIGCGACANVCPARAIQLVDDKENRLRKLTVHYDVCIFCGQCERYCTTEKGIAQSNDYDLATLDRGETTERVEKELVLCEHCGEVIGAKDHLCWLARKLGPQAYATPTLFLVDAQEREAGAAPIPRDPAHPGLRSDLVRVLCPRCRRNVFLAEEWK